MFTSQEQVHSEVSVFDICSASGIAAAYKLKTIEIDAKRSPASHRILVKEGH